MIIIRPLNPAEFDKVRSIDVTESGSVIYKWQDGKLVETRHTWRRSPWTEERHAQSIRSMQAVHAEGGTVLGALDGDLLVGEAVLRPRLTERMAQLESLHISHDYRRQGVARRLVQEIIRLARAGGAQELYVSATPSESAVSFYQRMGFVPTTQPHPDLYRLEPDDIHMTMPL